MKPTKKFLLTLSLLILITSCGDKQSKESESTEIEKITEQKLPEQQSKTDLELRNEKFGLFTFMDKLEVKSGQTLTITPDMKFIITREWIMEDNSTINFADGVQTFVVNAEEAKWGENVLIDGRGKVGVKGKDGVQGQGRSEAGDCATGNSGGNAFSGTNGTNGINMDLTIGLSSLVSAKILAQGGNGGPGGNGGNGVSGTKGDCSSSCNGGNGGNGGRGGRGGHAGDGGDVTISYKFLNTGMDIGALSVEVDGGNPGAAGNAGTPGNGGAGKSCFGRNRSGGKNGVSLGTLGAGNAGIAGYYKPIKID